MSTSRILVGLLLTLAGVILLLDRAGGIERSADLLEQWWPLAIVLFGATNLVRIVRRPWSFWGPVLVMAAGLALLLVTIEPVPEVAKAATKFIWPLVLVAAGLVVALAGIQPQDGQDHFLRQSAVLRERRFSTSAKSLRHGRARAFLGHLELDLREAGFRDREADLDITAVCGQVDVLIPRGYEVELRPPVGFGVRAIEPRHVDGHEQDEESGQLTVHLLAFFGRAELKQP